MVSWLDVTVAAIITNTVAVIVKGVYSHFGHQRQNELLEQILEELKPKG